MLDRQEVTKLYYIFQLVCFFFELFYLARVPKQSPIFQLYQGSVLMAFV
jgi:hypothetical protein